MKREPWAIGNAFAYGVRILNSIFCREFDEKDWTEEEKEMGENNKWLVAEQVNSMCSHTMIMDTNDVIGMICSMPNNRLCEQINCQYHHPENPERHNFCHYQEKCDNCIHNKWLYSKIDKDIKVDSLKLK